MMPRLKHKHLWQVSPVYDIWGDGSRLESIQGCPECHTRLIRRYRPHPGGLRLYMVMWVERTHERRRPFHACPAEVHGEIPCICVAPVTVRPTRVVSV